ncbi:MAG: prephenate dehydrogenase [Terriglobales bacterium]
MPIRQITIIGTGLIGGSLGLALRKKGFEGKIIGCDQPDVLRSAKKIKAVHQGISDPGKACQGSNLVVLATPVGTIIDLVKQLAPHLAADALVTDVGSTKSEIVAGAQKAFGNRAPDRFLAGHPMAGKENSGIEFADADLFRDAVWFLTPQPGQNARRGLAGEYVSWLKKVGAEIAEMNPEEHDQLCAWISHVPQFLSTALAASLVEEYGENAPMLESGGRALREMTRIASSPYSMWRDVALTNKSSIAEALLKLEQHLAHIRENLDTRQLEDEFSLAHKLKKASSPRSHGGTEQNKKKKERKSS